MHKHSKDASSTDYHDGDVILPKIIENHNDDTDKTLKTMYSVACFANLIINLDHGIIPACTQELMNDLNIDEFELGLLGSVVYIGLLLGSMTSGPLLQNYSSKKIILLSTLGNIISLFIFPMTQSFFFLCLSRGLVGFFQVFLVIYFPVWVDTYGKDKKTLWLTFLQLGVALGVFFGYGLTAVFVKYLTWRISFYTQILLLAPCFVAFCLFEEKLMSTNNVVRKSLDLACEQVQEKYLLTISHSGSFFGNEILDYVIGNEAQGDKKEDKNRLQRDDDDENIGDKLTYMDYIKLLLEKKVYIFTMLAISALYFVITGIQFWISDYMRTVLKQPKETVFMAFALISITGPTLGVVVGGTLLDRIGGYTGKGALDFCLIVGLLASVVAIPVPFLNNFGCVCGLLWFLLFFGGALMPAVIGIMLSSIPKKIRAIGYSNAQIVQNFLGYVPAPVVYGFIVEKTGGDDSRFGMVLLMIWSTVGVFCLFAAKIARIQKHENYMKQQFIEVQEEELQKPDLFEPRPKIIELKEIYDESMIEEGDVYELQNLPGPRHTRRRTFGEPRDSLIGRRSLIKTPQSGGKIKKELEALGQATVDYKNLRQSKPGMIISNEDLGNINMMFGRPTADKQRTEIKDEML